MWDIEIRLDDLSVKTINVYSLITLHDNDNA